MPTVRNIPAKVYRLAIEDESVRRRRSQALARIRRRRRTLPPDAPDIVTMLRQMRGYDE